MTNVDVRSQTVRFLAFAFSLIRMFMRIERRTSGEIQFFRSKLRLFPRGDGKSYVARREPRATSSQSPHHISAQRLPQCHVACNPSPERAHGDGSHHCRGRPRRPPPAPPPPRPAPMPQPASPAPTAPPCFRCFFFPIRPVHLLLLVAIGPGDAAAGGRRAAGGGACGGVQRAHG